MRRAHHIHIVLVIACIIVAGAIGCTGGLDSVSGTTSALGDDSGEYQVLGNDFVEPPNETTTPEPGPDPALCIGPTTLTTSAAPYANAAGDGTASLDWALSDFQPQSCGFESVYGIDSFSDRVTLAVLLASW